MNETELERLMVRLLGDSASYTKMMNDAQASAKDTANKVQQSGKQIESVSTSLQSFAASAVTALGGIAGAASGLSAFSDFDKAMVESTAIMKITEEQSKHMRDAALSLASQGARGADVYAKSFFYLASAGLDAERAIAALPVVAQFATAGAFDMATATTLASDAQAALGLKVKDSAQNVENLTRVTDVLVKANVLANANVMQFSQALTGGAAASLKSFNKDMEEGVAVLAAMADQGMKAEFAGNTLARVMRLLSASAISHTAAHRQLNFQVFDETGKMKNLADIIENLEQIMAGMSDQTKASTLDMLGFEARIQGAILPLIGTSGAIREYEKALRDAKGTTGEVAEKMKSSFSAQMAALQNQVKLVAIDIGTYLSPALAFMANLLRITIDTWRQSGDMVKQFTVGIALLIGTMIGIGPVMTLLRPLGGIIASGIAPLMTLGPLIISMLVNPFKLAIFWFNPTFVLLRNIISVAAAAIVAIQRTGGIEEAWRKVEETLIGVYEWLKPIGAALADLGGAILRQVIAGFIKMGEVMLDTLTVAFGYINIDWQKVQDAIIIGIKIIELAVTNLGDIIKMIGQGFSALLSPFTKNVNEGAKSTLNLSAVLDTVIRHLIVITGVILTTVVAWKLASGAIALVTFLYSALQVQQILSIGWWVVSTAVVLAYKAVMILLSGIMGVYNVIMLTTGSVVLGVTAALMALTSVALASYAAFLLLATTGLTLLGTALASVVSPIVGAYIGLVQLTRALQEIPTDTGVLKTVGNIFSEWGSILGDVVRAMRVDMPLAWALFQAGVELGVAQMRAVWPTLWEFIKEGFAITARLIKGVMGEVFDYIANRITITSNLWTGGFSSEQAQEEVNKLGKIYDDRIKQMTATAGREFKAAASKVELVDDKAITDARAKVQTLTDQLDVEEAWTNLQKEMETAWNETLSSTAKKAEETSKKTGDAFTNGVTPPIKAATAAMEKFDSTIAGSAEAITRFQQYASMFSAAAIQLPGFKATSGLGLPQGTAEAASVANTASAVTEVATQMQTIEQLIATGPPQTYTASEELWGETVAQYEAVIEYEAQQATTLEQILEVLSKIFEVSSQTAENTGVFEAIEAGGEF